MTMGSGAPDVVVVGGGVAGLTAACHLARAGAGVTVFERSSRLGGRAATYDSDGFRFNVGIHALYTGGAMSRVLDELQIPYTHGTPPSTSVLRDGTVHHFPTDPVGLLRSDLLSARTKLVLIAFFVTLNRTRPADVRHLSVRAWLDAKVNDPRLDRLLTGLACTAVYSTALDLVSADVFVDKFQRSLRHPVHYIDGGWQTLVDGLRDVAVERGVTLRRGEGVEAVTIQDDRVTGVRLHDGGVVGAPAVLLATTATDAAKLTDAAASPALRRIVDRLQPVRVACLDVALARLPVPDHPVVQDLDAPRFVSAQSVASRVAPDGAALLVSFKQLDPRAPVDPRGDEHDLAAFLDTVQPGWRELVVRRRFLPAIEAVGAMPVAASGGMAGRPDAQVPGIAGLHVAGDWVGPEGFLVDASAASAVAAARLIAGAAPARTTGPADRAVA